MPLHRKALAFFAAVSTFSVVSTTAQAADYHVYRSINCGANPCYISFPFPSPGKTLTLKNFSCYLRMPQSSDLYGAQLLRHSFGFPLVAITPSLYKQNTVRTSATVLEDVFVSNDTIHAVVSGYDYFQAYAEARNGSTGAVGTISQFACHISGTLTP